MQQSIEGYFLFNFILDTALMAVIARSNGCFRLRRVTLCGLIAAAYGAITELYLPRLAHPFIQLALLVPLALILCGNPSPQRWGAIAFQLVCGAMMLGGCATLSGKPFRRETLVVSSFLGAGLLLLYILLSVRAQRILTWEVTVCLQCHGKSISFRALIDTGNRLREPISGLPVLIAESSLLQCLFPDPDLPPVPCRNVAFGALGGGGNIRCFHPDHVMIRRGEQLIQAPEVWVALYPGKIPGNARALAPPSFAVIPGKC